MCWVTLTMIIKPGVRARFTLLYGAAMIVTVVLVTSGIYFFVQRALVGQIENHLRKDMASIREYLKNDISDLQKLASHGPIDFFTVRLGKATLVSSDDWKANSFDELPAKNFSTANTISAVTKNSISYLLQSSQVDMAGVQYHITVAHQEEGIRQTLRTLSQIILFILPVAVTVSLLIGYVIAGKVLSPIASITRKAAEIGADNLSDRLPLGDSDDEFTRLAAVFNQTFARIEDSFLRLKRFTADASHELRTPLAAIRSIGETALHKNDMGCESCEAIGSILEETDRLRQLVDSLLLLSRADAGEILIKPEATDLVGLTQETIDLLNVLAEEKFQTITLHAIGEQIAMVDRSSVRQALTNLLDNAIKYSPQHSKITITVERTPKNRTSVEFSDNGPGIAPEHLDHIFDRFYRIDKGRSREMGGAGLGLSIAKWVVESNGGSIEVKSQQGVGSVFKVIF